MLTIERMKQFPDEKILFLAPTRPLAEQHLQYFKKHLPELWATMELFTGKTDAEKRKKLWQNADIVFSTPQCLQNDIHNTLYSTENVSLLIIDECHRCVKNYSYTYVAEKYREQAKNPRVLGLTASPGSEKAKIKQIIEKLGIEAVEIRTRDSEDVKEYLQELKFEIIKLDFPKELSEIRDLLKKIYDKKVEELKSRKLLFMPPTKKFLLECQHKIMRSIATGNKHFNLLLGASACAIAIKLSHALELLETQTLSSFLSYLQDLFSQAEQKKSRAVQSLVKSPEFNQAYIKTQELITRKIEHPKLAKLKEIIETELKNNPKMKTIVFAQFRETLLKINRTLNEINGVNARIFVGQAIKTNEKGEQTGLSQKEQREIIGEFSLGKINVLCASSVHPEEYIILKKGNRITIKKIGKFVDSFINKTANKTLSKKIKGWEALTSNGAKVFFRPVTHVHKHPARSNCIKIKLASGFDCFITEDHSLFSFNSEKKFISSAPKLNKFVALSLICPNLEQDEKIDVLKEIYENCPKEEINNIFGSLNGLSQAKIRMLKTELNILSGIDKKMWSITELSKLTKHSYSTVADCLKRLANQDFLIQKRQMKNYRNLSEITEKGKNYLCFLEWFFKSIKYRKRKYRFRLGNITKNPKEFNNLFEQSINVDYGKTKFPRFLELNESLARFLGFYVSEGSARKTKYTSDLFLAAQNKKMQKMMMESISNGLNLKTRKNWRGIAIDSQIAYYLIRDVFRAGIGAYNKEVPEIIFTAPRNIKLEFLRAYFLGDGHHGKERITLTTVSRKLVVGIVLLLRMLGITRVSINKNQHIYQIAIHESLPFAKIKEKSKKRGHAYFSLIPNAIKSSRAYNKHSNFFNYNPRAYLKCRKVGRWEEDICFDYIKRLEQIEKPKFVYDLSVKETENFIGGTGLFCLHNSIGEEGLDIPEVNAVIFYEPIPSEIRSIQRRGRTARLKPGKLTILMTTKTRDEAYYWAAFSKEKKMKSAVASLQKDFENDFKNPEGKKEKDNQERLF